MLALVAFWSHALAALLYATLAVWQLRHWRSAPLGRPLVAAFLTVAVWAIFAALLGPRHAAAALTESMRNLTFLAFLYGIVRSAAEDGRQRAVRLVCMTVAAVVGIQIVLVGLHTQFADTPIVRQALDSTLAVIGMTIAAGSLVLVHNVYGQAAPDSRWGIRLPMIALAALWGYDLHLYTMSYLTDGAAADLFAMRGAIAAMLVPLFALAGQRNAAWRMRLSRAATFQSLSLLAILFYLVLMIAAMTAVEVAGGDWVEVGQVGLVFAITVAAAILLPSGRARAWLRVMVAKHFFEHRYDYREEWLRFTRTMTNGGEDAAPLDQRMLKALADIADAPAALLLTVDDRGRLVSQAHWNWPLAASDTGGAPVELTHILEADPKVIAFGKGASLHAPEWLTALEGAWAGIPLVHAERLVGLVVLQHPLVRRPLDWEDFDLFRTAGIQAASYLAEARSQEALANAGRFDEFNRRFAFILHDIKNLVSQLSLVARNAERHADNPEFRADMIATLQASVKKMNDLLARLSRGRNDEGEAPHPIAVGAVAASIGEAKRRLHKVELSADPSIFAVAAPAALEAALGHLVQNAIDASAPDAPVRIAVARRDGDVAIEVADTGSGMSGDFIRTRLFQPFASTKDGGFGIGAFEARTLVAAMGGRIEVDSREGEGTRFTIILPAAAMEAPPQIERMRA